MDEVILQTLTAAPVNAEQQIKTMNYFEELKNSETGWQLCVQAVSSKTYGAPEVQFFCFQVIEHFVKTRYLMSSFEHQSILKDFLCSWRRMQVVQPSAFLRNKVAQIIALLFVQEYPVRWPNFFDVLLSTLGSSDSAAAVDQYLRVLDAIDTEIADREISRTSQELQRSNAIKDAMREKVVGDLVDSWFQILTAFECQNSVVTCHCLQVVGKYIVWIDINLVANDRFVPILVKHLSDVHLREAAADCINEIIWKGMDPVPKTKLIESFCTVLSNYGVWQALQDDNDSEYVSKLGKIVMAMGCNLIESYYKVVKTNGKQHEVSQAVYQALESHVPLVLEFFQNDYDDVSSSIFPCIRDYLHLLKNEAVMTDAQNKNFMRMLEIVTKKFRYDEEYDFIKEGEDEAEFLEFRKQLKVVYENLGMTNKTIVFAHVLNLVTVAVHNWIKMPFQDVEVALLLMYYLGEAVPSVGTVSFSSDLDKPSIVQTLLIMVLNSDIHMHPHPAVVLQYFETIVRYDKFFVYHPDYICRALENFLKENGLSHPDKKVRSRCAYLFCRFIKCVRNHITMQLANNIIQAIQPLLVMVTPSKNMPSDPLMTPDDQLYLYEVVGVVIISGERSNEKTELMKRVVNQLLETCRVVTEQLRVEKDPDRQEDLANVIIQAISVTGRLSKAFSNQLSMKSFGCIPLFLDALQVFLHSVEVSNGEQQLGLQSCVRQYLHRMVVCLEEELLPYIPAASQVLLKNCDSKSIQEYIPLINQVICKFKLSWIFQKEVVPFLKQMFTPMVLSVFKSLSEPFEENDQIAMREHQMLQRQYFDFINTIVTHNIDDVFSAEENSQVLEQVMLSVIQGSVEDPDPLAQKSCFSILRTFVGLWGGQNNPVGFIDFMYKHIVPACFMAPCKPHFDMNDAQTLLVVNEIGQCLITISEQRKEECIAYLQTHYLPTLDLPSATIQEFILALQSPPRNFKLYLKAFFRQVKS